MELGFQDLIDSMYAQVFFAQGMPAAASDFLTSGFADSKR